MKYEYYLEKIKSRYGNDNYVDKLKVHQFYDEKFEIKWAATKLKQYSFVGYTETITPELLEAFAGECTSCALDIYKGLPRGMQNAVVSFAVLAGENITQDAMDYIKKAPKKHWAAFEMPVIADLKNEKIYYFEKTPMWGAIYYKYFRSYMEENFKF